MKLSLAAAWMALALGGAGLGPTAAAVAGSESVGAAPARAHAAATLPADGGLDSIAAVAARRGFMGSVLVTRGSRVLLDRADGFADLARRVPDLPVTRYEIGSLTKQFTAAAIFLLEQQGALRTTDAVVRWIPEAAPRWNGVTLRQLLTHTAGVPDSDFDDASLPYDSTRTPGENAVRLALRRPLDFAPGSAFAYSNLGYLVLGRVIELASGTRYEDFIRTRLIEPLGLHDTSFEGARGVVGYTNRRGPVRTPPPMNLHRANAAGGLWSTTRDLARWEQALYGGRVLADTSLATMTTAVHDDYACGVHHRRSPGREVMYHTGRTSGFESVLGWYPADSVAVVVLTNLDGSRSVELYDALAAAAHSTGGR